MANIRKYKNAPDNLMGYRKSGQNKGFNETKYPHTQEVSVTFPATKSSPRETFTDQMKGMNGDHAIERAHRNWPDAMHITPVYHSKSGDVTSDNHHASKDHTGGSGSLKGNK